MAKLCRNEYMVRTISISMLLFVKWKLIMIFTVSSFLFFSFFFSITGGLVYSYLTFSSSSSTPTANQEEDKLVQELQDSAENRQFSDTLTLQSVKPTAWDYSTTTYKAAIRDLVYILYTNCRKFPTQSCYIFYLDRVFNHSFNYYKHYKDCVFIIRL